MSKDYTMKLKVIFFLTLTVCFTQLKADDNIRVSTLNEIAVDEIELDYSTMANLERSQSQIKAELQKDINLILKAKFKLISGDIKMAEFYLNQVNSQTTRLLTLKNRYLSIIKFIDGRYKDSLSLLEDKRMGENGSYSQICLLKLFNLMALDKTRELNDEFSICTALTDKFTKNDHFWLNLLFRLKTKDMQGIKSSLITDVEQTLRDDEMSRLWLKAGLFLNKEKELLGILSILSENSYSSKKIREIIALMYLRDGDKDRALLFVDDIDTANAENIKGNIYLQSKQYELAFGHFKLALNKKENSENSLERAIPLSWLLNQFEDGLYMLNKTSNKQIDKRKEAAIRIAYLIRLKRFEEAQTELTLLKNQFQNIAPFEVNIMDSYVNLILGVKKDSKKYDQRKVENSSELACKNYDGISCWISLSNMHWENLGKTIKRDEDTFSDKSMTLESLKSKKELKPIVETPTIDQKDIEELDSDTITINPS